MNLEVNVTAASVDHATAAAEGIASGLPFAPR